jgi:hypothetical protein
MGDFVADLRIPETYRKCLAGGFFDSLSSRFFAILRES